MNIAQALTIRGWMSEPELLFLAEQATKHHNIVEVGSFCGRSSRALADNTPGQVHCIDPWDGICQVYGMYVHSNGYNNEFREFQHNLRDHVESGKVKYFKGFYTDFWIERPDMIFIDAIHEYNALKADILHSLKMLKSGILCGHDYAPYWPDVKKIVDEVFPTAKIEDTIWYVEL